LKPACPRMEPWQFEFAHPDLVKIGTMPLTKLSLGLSAAERPAELRANTTSHERSSWPSSAFPIFSSMGQKRSLRRAAGRYAREPPSAITATPLEPLPTRVNCFQTLPLPGLVQVPA
jgi:hypothetical protein